MLRFALPALAIAGAAHAASCSAEGTATVVSPGDATALSACKTFTGSVAIATEAAGSFDFGNLGSITGDLMVTGATNVSAISANNLGSIGGKFTVDNLQTLSTLSFTALTEVGSLDLSGLPNLNGLNFNGPLSSAESINIQNTFLASLTGINLLQINSIYIANNRLLQDISFQVSKISGSVNIESNGDKLTTSFPNLQTAQNLTFRNCPSVSIPSLSNTTGSLGLYESSLQSIFAPNLTTVGGTLAINTNTALGNISMPLLKTISGGLQVQNNTILKEVSFPALQTVTGATDMYGNFTSISLPALKDNRGAFNIQSSQDITSSCNVFNGEKGANNVIKGKFQCAGNQDKPGGENSTPTGSGASSTKKSEAGDIRINTAAVGLSGVLAAIFGLM